MWRYTDGLRHCSLTLSEPDFIHNKPDGTLVTPPKLDLSHLRKKKISDESASPPCLMLTTQLTAVISPVTSLVKSLLLWNPQQRLTMERVCAHRIFSHTHYVAAYDFPDDDPTSDDDKFRRPLPSKTDRLKELSKIVEVDEEGPGRAYRDAEMKPATPLREGKGKGRQLGPGGDMEMSPAKRVRR